MQKFQSTSLSSAPGIMRALKLRQAVLLLPFLLCSCLVLGDNTPPPYDGPNAAPVLANARPPLLAEVAIDNSGQLFEVWVKDPNHDDSARLSIEWQLEGIGVVGQGSKLFLRPQELPETNELLTLKVVVRDEEGLSTETDIEWYLMTPEVAAAR